MIAWLIGSAVLILATLFIALDQEYDLLGAVSSILFLVFMVIVVPSCIGQCTIEMYKDMKNEYSVNK